MLFELVLFILGFALGVAAAVWWALGVPDNIKKEIDAIIDREKGN